MRTYLLITLAILLLSHVAKAQRYEETDKVFPPSEPTVEGHKFGSSVAIDGDYAVVASHGNYQAAGKAYVFHRQGTKWNRVAKLALSNPDPDHNYIRGVAISDSTVLVSYHHHSKAAAYIYIEPTGGWKDTTENAILTSSLYTGFTMSDTIAVEGNTIVLGTRDSGVLVYEKPDSGWTSMTQAAILTSSDDILFGHSPAISEHTVVVGSHAGAIYVFERPEEGWHDMTQTSKLTASGEAPKFLIGSAVDIYGSTIVASANNYYHERETAFIFEKPREGWVDNTETARLTRSGTDDFIIGKSIAVTNSTVAISVSGGFLIYCKPILGWANTAETLIIPSDNGIYEPMDISDSTILVGISDDDTRGTDVGAALFYTRQPNHPPVLTRPVADQSIVVQKAFSFVIMKDLFSDIDGDSISYSATLADGSPLPMWLSFYVNTLTFSGKPLTNDVGELSIKITATDGHEEVSALFTITVLEKSEEKPTDEESADEEKKPVDEEKPDLQEDTITGIYDEAKEQEILLYPNPSAGRFHIRSENEPIRRIVISNGLGQVVIDHQYASGRDSATLDFLPSGIYQAHIQTEYRVTNRHIVVK